MSIKNPLALEVYDQLAEAYAARVDTKPHNAYYERPATLSLLPDVAGLNVVDAGCGPGAYSEWLVQHGAQVVAIDASAKMLACAKARVGTGAEFHQALEGGLPFLQDGFFDLGPAPLVMDYVADWGSAFRRCHQVLKPDGLLVFSAGHPFFDAVYFKTDNYFATEQVSCVWTGFGVPVEMPSYRRSLSSVINSVLESGFALVQILEPLPTEAFKNADPVLYEQLSRQPGFLCVKARKRVESRESISRLYASGTQRAVGGYKSGEGS